ncbi:MAG: bifunctional 4-hydroxy-2-oxoglutarate aldolase/2-dehydro-3-deoxy-phosphogluconate aldolase [Nitrospina sp.]|nr:MAG: bifunctional 4-hydroxy-2-oxoglutarate aldolase/2-dehydro-3-deoxy-phosphogluconate aldolase [Nitrospina sp.]
MTASKFSKTLFEEEPVVGIIRGVPEKALEGVLEASVKAGLKFAEITLNTPQAPELIARAVEKFSDSLCIGAGTVLSATDAETAVSAGASFLVSPTLHLEVADYCNKHGLPYFPGAFTPTEIEKAWSAGAYMVKIFPSCRLGPRYFKDIKGPFGHIKLLAVGGIHADNILDYLSAGASAVAVGGSIFSISRMENCQFSPIQKDLKEILFAVKNYFTTIK